MENATVQYPNSTSTQSKVAQTLGVSGLVTGQGMQRTGDGKGVKDITLANSPMGARINQHSSGKINNNSIDIIVFYGTWQNARYGLLEFLGLDRRHPHDLVNVPNSRRKSIIFEHVSGIYKSGDKKLTATSRLKNKLQVRYFLNLPDNRVRDTPIAPLQNRVR